MSTPTHEHAYTPHLPRVGSRVVLRPPHPWAGRAGTVTSIDRLAAIRILGARVELDGGQACYVTQQRHWQRAASSR